MRRSHASIRRSVLSGIRRGWGGRDMARYLSMWLVRAASTRTWVYLGRTKAATYSPIWAPLHG